MADIHILPDASTPAEPSRAYDVLRRSVEAGHDLGDRGHHVRVISARVEAVIQDLQREIKGIRHLPPLQVAELEVLAHHIDEWLRAISALAAALGHTSPAPGDTRQV